jgi:hypothetical protein
MRFVAFDRARHLGLLRVSPALLGQFLREVFLAFPLPGSGLSTVMVIA